MSKTLVLTLSFALTCTGCSKSEKVSYVEPDVAQELSKLSKDEVLRAPEGATTSVKLMYAMKVDQSMKSMMVVMQPELMKVALATDENFDHEKAAFFQQIALELVDELMPELINKFAGIYAERFSEEELRQLLEFHSSDVGKKLAAEQQNLMADGLSIGVFLETELEKRMQERVGEYTASKEK